MHDKDGKTNRAVKIVSIFIISMLLFAPLVSLAADRYWTGSVGDGLWGSPGNWDNGVPGIGDKAILNIPAAVTYDYTLNPILGTVEIGSGSGAVTFNHSANTLTIGGENSLSIDGVNATYNLSGMGELVKESFEVKVGIFGTGNFNQSGDTSFQLGGALYLGDQLGGQGAYTMTGGSLEGWNGTRTVDIDGIRKDIAQTWYGSIVLGEWGGTGEFLQSGGTVTIDNLTLARQANSIGKYYLSGDPATSTLTSNGVTVGGLGVGTFYQGYTYDLVTEKVTSVSNGGTHTVNGDLNIASSTGADGSAYFLNSGDLSVGGVERIGVFGQGNFEQSGGTHTVTGDLILGDAVDSTGIYNLYDDTLTVYGITRVGNNGLGSFYQNGGIFDANEVWVGVGQYQEDEDHNPINGYGSYRLVSGALNTGYLIIGGKDVVGLSGVGVFTQDGGTVYTGGLWVGDTIGSIGTYTLNDGDLEVNRWNVIGMRGAGTFDQYGGTHTANYILEVGGAGTGTYNLVDGTLSTNGTIVGNWGTGIFKQSGGIHEVRRGVIDHDEEGNPLYGGDLVLGANGETSGTYKLYGGDLNVTGTTFVGFFGTGAFTQSGGTHTTSGLVLGQFKGSSGTYALSGDGYLSIANDIYLGVEGTGSFIQNDTSTVEANNLFIGTSGGAGTYELRGGSLSLTGVVNVGYSGIGTFLLSGDSSVLLQVGGNELIGWGGTGTFAQDGGTHTVAGDLNLAQGAPTEGYFNLNGGNLSVDGSLNIGHDGLGLFTQNGGTNTVGWNLVLGNNATGNGTYVLENGTLEVSGSFRGGDGTSTFIIDGQPGDGITGYSLTYPDETLSLTNFIVGSASGKTGLFTLPAGRILLTNRIDVGTGGTGTFNQTGGTTMVNNVLAIGRETGALGTYTLSGEEFVTLTTGETHVGAFGTGTLTQSGGTHTTGTLVLGYNTGGTGTYDLSGGSLSSDFQRIGMDGTGTFRQTGGSNTVSDTLVIAQVSTATGRYEMLGGTLTATNINNNANGTFIAGAGTTTTVTSAFNNYGLMSGAGTIAGNVYNNGTVSPGGSPGTLTINGNYTQDALGTLLIELGSEKHDLLSISGTASLTGTLDIDLYDGYKPTAGTSFDILIANAIMGIGSAGFTGFTNIIGPKEWIWTVQYLDGDDTDTVQLTANAVPIPGAVWLFVPSLLGLIGLRRRLIRE